MSNPICKCGHSHNRRYDWCIEMGGTHIRHDTVCPYYPDGCSCWQYEAIKTRIPVRPTICRHCGTDTTFGVLADNTTIGKAEYHQAECMSVDIPMPADHPRMAFWNPYMVEGA